VLLFRAVGAVRLRETWAHLRAKSAHCRQEREEQEAFEHLQLRFRQVAGPQERWLAICEAAQRLDLAWVSLRVTDPGGGIDTSVWRRPETPPTPSRVVTLSLPVNDARDDSLMEFEVAVLINGSLESASHRAGLFSRLVEEQASARSTVEMVHV
jgi:hypothetical protein